MSLDKVQDSNKVFVMCEMRNLCKWKRGRSCVRSKWCDSAAIDHVYNVVLMLNLHSI